MKCKKYTISVANLNTGSEFSNDITISAPTGGYVSYPQDIMFVNNTNAVLGVIYLSSDDEIIERTNNPTLYDFLPLDTGRSVGSLPSHIKYVIIKKLSGTASSSDLDFYTINYLTDY